MQLCKSIVAHHPALRVFLLECTELPPFADDVRMATGLPVFDAITAADWVMSAKQDNGRFGLNDWQQVERAPTFVLDDRAG